MVPSSAFCFRQFFVNPCMCRSCKNAYSWFKIPAMLLACFCLLMWLSLVGRRAYLRRVHFPTVRGAACCSLTDLDYLGSNLDYVVRPRAFSGTRLSQSHRVQLYSPSRTVIRGTRVAQNSSQPEGSRRFPNSPGIFGNDSTCHKVLRTIGLYCIALFSIETILYDKPVIF